MRAGKHDYKHIFPPFLYLFCSKQLFDIFAWGFPEITEFRGR